MIGTGDLRLSMRLSFGFDGAEPEYTSAMETIERAAKKNKLPLVGFAFGSPAVEARVKRGYQCLMVASDMVAMIAGQSIGLAAGRTAVVESKKVENLPETSVHARASGGPESAEAVNGQ